MLGALLSKYISCFSHALLMVHRNLTIVSEEQVLSFLGPTLPEIFAEFMNVTEPCVSSEELTGLIVREITENVNSVLNCLGSGEPLISVVICPSRLSVMVELVCNMIKTQRRLRSQSLNVEDVDTEDECDKENESPVTSGKPKISVSAISQAVQEIISKELITITDPDLNDVQSASSSEIQIVADYITQLIVKEVKRLKEADSVSPETKEKCIQLIDRAVRKIKTFFAKQFTKSSIHCMAAHLKATFNTESKEESKESMRSLFGQY